MPPPRPRGFLDRPLDRLTAGALAAYLGWAGQGRCELLPPGPGSPGWVVLVSPPEGGDPRALTSFATASPFLARASGVRRHDEMTRSRIGSGVALRAVERQVRRELARTLAKEEAQEEAQR